MADNGTTPPPFDIAHFMGGLIMELGIALMYGFNFWTSVKLLSHTLLSSRLYGVTTAQAYVYMLNSKKDPWWLKIMVTAVW